MKANSVQFIIRSLAGTLLATLFAIASGCGTADEPQATATTKTANSATTDATSADEGGFVAQRPATRYDDPRQSVNDFLLAVKAGNDAVATQLLTTEAQREAWTNGMAISAEGFPDARFQISEVEYINDQKEAHVLSTWADRTPSGQEKTFQCVWLLKHEAHGWCIYGMASKFLDHVQPIVLNFEDQAEMLQRQQWAEQQIRKHQELLMHQQEALTQGPATSTPATPIPAAPTPAAPVRQAALPTTTR